MERKERIHYFDIAKGIAILSVIIGHFGIDSINRVVFSFHMPLFFLISGYFLRTDNNFQSFVVKKARQLIWPYITTVAFVAMGAMIYRLYDTHSAEGVLALGWNWIKAGIYGAGSEGAGLPEGIWPIGAIWFLLALFFAMLEVRFLVEKKYGFVLILFIAYFASVLREYVWLPLSIQMGALCAIFVYFGEKAREVKVLEKNFPFWVKGMALIIWGIYIAYCGIFSAVQGVLTNGLLDLIVPVIGTFFVLELSKSIEKHTAYLTKILEFYGKNTLIILCAHLFELNVFPWDKIWPFLAEECHLGFYTQVWVLFVFKIIWATVAVLFIKRIPVLREIYQGKGISEIIERIKAKNATLARGEGKNWMKAVVEISALLLVLGNDLLREQQNGTLYSIAVVMLFILLGMKLNANPGNKEMKSGIKYLIIPYMAFAIPTLLLGAVLVLIKRWPIRNLFHSIISLVGGMSAASRHFNSLGTVQLVWIFPCMFISLLIYILGGRMIKKIGIELRALLVFVCALLGCAIGVYYAFMPWAFDISLVMVLFIFFGTLLGAKKVSEKGELAILLVSGTSAFLLLMFGIDIDIVGRNYSCMPFGLLLGLSAGIFAVLGIKQLYRIKCFKFIAEKVGQYTPFVLGTYYIEVVFFDWRTLLEEHISVELTACRAWVIRIIMLMAVIFLCERFRAKLLYRRRNDEK